MTELVGSVYKGFMKLIQPVIWSETITPENDDFVLSLIPCTYINYTHTVITLVTYHPEKYVTAMVLVFQNIKVVVDWPICSDCRTIHRVFSSNADFLVLCNILVQHILSKVYWWGKSRASKQQGLQWPWPPLKTSVSELVACNSWLIRLSWSVFCKGWHYSNRPV